MLNIFNLFLFLFGTWSLLMFVAGKISWLFTAVGILVSFLISLFSYKLNLIDKRTQFPFLQTGFYIHFFKIYVNNFIASIALLVILAFGKRSLSVSKKFLKTKEDNIIDSVVIATINMSVGLLCVDCDSEGFLVTSLGEEYFRDFDFEGTLNSLRKFNDDEI